MKRYRCAVVPGSFDPITVGHLDLIKRACGMFDTVYVTAFRNAEKHGMFMEEEKLHMMRLAVKDLPNAVCSVEDGVLADFAKAHNAVIVKGLRNGTDFDYETSLAYINRAIADAETVFLPASQEYLHISSSYVREMLRYHGDFSKAVPEAVWLYLTKEWKPKQ